METETIVVKCGHTIKIQLKCTLIDMRLEIFDNLCKETQNYQDLLLWKNGFNIFWCASDVLDLSQRIQSGWETGPEPHRG